VQSVFDEHECKFIIFHDANVLLCVSWIFYRCKSYLVFISVRMSDISNLKWTVFTCFVYGEFIGAIKF